MLQRLYEKLLKCTHKYLITCFCAPHTCINTWVHKCKRHSLYAVYIHIYITHTACGIHFVDYSMSLMISVLVCNIDLSYPIYWYYLCHDMCFGSHWCHLISWERQACGVMLIHTLQFGTGNRHCITNICQCHTDHWREPRWMLMKLLHDQYSEQFFCSPLWFQLSCITFYQTWIPLQGLAYIPNRKSINRQKQCKCAQYVVFWVRFRSDLLVYNN